jgi:hypothetical protein
MKDRKRKEKKSVVLAIYPNFRGFGYALMETALNLIDAKVVPIRPVSNRKNLKRVKKLFDYYKPQVVIVEDYKGIGSRKSKRIQHLIRSITRYATASNLRIEAYSRANIRVVFSNFNARTKHEIAKVISDNIPIMKTKLMEERKADETDKYTAGAFDAVSLAITHFYLNG